MDREQDEIIMSEERRVHMIASLVDSYRKLQKLNPTDSWGLEGVKKAIARLSSKVAEGVGE